MPEVPTIPQLFKGKSVLVTGVTGFVGKVLLEKLLRCCPDVDRIYVIVRPKRGDSVSERMREMFSIQFFDRCRAERGSIQWRCGAVEEESEEKRQKGPVVVGLAGDVSSLGLGLSSADRAVLEEKVSVVFHVAATVRFNEALRLSVLLNTRGTREMLDLARSMKQLKAFVHVSTAYAHVSNFEGIMEEKFYPVPIEPEVLIKAAEEMDDDQFQEIADEQAKYYCNTYLCTKALGERIIEKDYKDLPVSVFRPGIVLSTLKEPLPGWSEGFQGPSVCIIGCATGMVGPLFCDGLVKPELVPVDHVVNAMLSVAWSRALEEKSIAEVPIYNFVSSKVSKVTWEIVKDVTESVLREMLQEMQQSISLNTRVCLTKSTLLYDSSDVIRQFIAKALDILQGFRGKSSKVAFTQRKIKSGIDSLIYFMNNEFRFSDANVHALLKKVRLEASTGDDFDFDVTRIDWIDYLRSYAKYLIRTMLASDTKGDSPSNKTQTFRLLYRSAQVVGTIFSCASLYLLSTSARGLYMHYVTLQD